MSTARPSGSPTGEDVGVDEDGRPRRDRARLGIEVEAENLAGLRLDEIEDAAIGAPAQSVRQRQIRKDEGRLPILVESPQAAEALRETHLAAARPEPPCGVGLRVVHSDPFRQDVRTPVDDAVGVEPDEPARHRGDDAAAVTRSDGSHHLGIRGDTRLAAGEVRDQHLTFDDVDPVDGIHAGVPDRPFTALGTSRHGDAHLN